MIALLGNLSRDLVRGERRVGGGAYHGARALRRLRVPVRIFARCAEADREELFVPVADLGATARFVRGTATASFAFSYDGEHRTMRVASIGDTWQPEDVPELPESVRWAHVAPLVRSDFPASTLARIAQRRRILLDGQGLVRVPKLGPLELDADFDPEVLPSIWALKLAEEEAEVLGDPRALGVRELLVTHGSRGVTLHAGGRVEYIAARPVGVADPTGAGDAFCISYVAARAVGLPPAAAARRAMALVASLLDAG